MKEVNCNEPWIAREEVEFPVNIAVPSPGEKVRSLQKADPLMLMEKTTLLTEFSSKITLSYWEGIDAPAGPPLKSDQCADEFQSPVPPTQ